MPLDLEDLLKPLSADEPCGPELRYEDRFADARKSFTEIDEDSAQGGGFPAQLGIVVADLAKTARDLRVWVWMTRLGLARDGLTGLADGLELIAAGLERWWEQLPPIDLEGVDASERFAERVNALLPLGATHNRFTDPHAVQNAGAGSASTALPTRLRRLNDELRAGIGRAGAELPATRARVLLALDRIEGLFGDRMTGADNPQLTFGFLRGALAGVAATPAAVSGGNGEAMPVVGAGLGPVGSRGEVVRALDLVLDYYRSNEPASPVPLLVARAKRLVNMSFFDAIKELAPSGLKELQGIAGKLDDGKAEAKG